MAYRLHRGRRARGYRHWVLATLFAGSLAGCSVSDLVKVPDPSNILDPDAVQTHNGAIALYNGAMTGFLQVFNGNKNSATFPFAISAGILSDEYITPGPSIVDQRIDDGSQSTDASFTWQNVSAAHLNMGQAIQFLKAYAPTAPKSYLAKAYMARGYMQIFFAELFCSGVPLSEATADGGTIMGRPLSRDELLRSALAKLDTALTYAEPDSARIINGIKVGRARVYMNLKEYDNAVTAVSGVPTDFAYNMTYSTSVSAGNSYFQSWTWETVADNEGINGLNYVSANDPRVVLDNVTNINGFDIMVVRKFRTSGTVQIPLESGINARLIEAEVMLSKSNTTGWLNALNALRTSCTSAASCPTPAPAGTGGVAGLPLLVDPGTAQARLLLMFRERAFWLFGTGHRQGDLRRLVRQYGLSQGTVYPTGPYLQGTQYGTQVTVTTGPDERTRNPYYRDGCFDREA